MVWAGWWNRTRKRAGNRLERRPRRHILPSNEKKEGFLCLCVCEGIVGLCVCENSSASFMPPIALLIAPSSALYSTSAHRTPPQAHAGTITMTTTTTPSTGARTITMTSRAHDVLACTAAGIATTASLATSHPPVLSEQTYLQASTASEPECCSGWLGCGLAPCTRCCQRARMEGWHGRRENAVPVGIKSTLRASRVTECRLTSWNLKEQQRSKRAVSMLFCVCGFTGVRGLMGGRPEGCESRAEDTQEGQVGSKLIVPRHSVRFK